MIPLPRVMYAMALDGMLFTIFGRVNNYTKTPLIATLVSGALSGVLALIFDLEQLIEMMSIGTLLAYTVVGLCVVVLRYTDSRAAAEAAAQEKAALAPPLTVWRSLAALFNCERAKRPTPLSVGAAGVLIAAQSESKTPGLVSKLSRSRFVIRLRKYYSPQSSLVTRPNLTVIAMFGPQFC